MVVTIDYLIHELLENSRRVLNRTDISDVQRADIEMLYFDALHISTEEGLHRGFQFYFDWMGDYLIKRHDFKNQ